MAAKLSQGLEDQVTCPICLEQFQDPRILTCLHTYCRCCLEKMLATKEGRRVSIKCPECQEMLKIEDVASLRVNIWVNRIISHLELFKAEKKQGDQPELMCNNCDSKEAAKAKCFDCGKFMCNACMAAHQRIATLKDHQLMTLEDIKRTGVPIIDKLMFCKKHKGEVQKLFCKTCEELICRDCTIIDHKDHDVCFIVDIAKEHKEKLTKEIKMASATKEKIEAGLKSVKAMQKQVMKNTDDIEKRIDDVINQQIQALEEKRINLKQESRDLAATKMKDLTAQEDGLAMHKTGLKSAIEFTENVLSKGSNSEVLSISKQILSRLSQLSSKPFDGEVKDEDNQVLQVDKEMLSDDILKFAKVIDDIAVIDPEQCEVKWSKNKFGRDVINVYIKNRLGRPVNIEKKRISINPFVVGISGLTPLGNGLLYLVTNNLLVHEVNPVTCNANEGHILKVVEFKVDGHHIRGSPVQLGLPVLWQHPKANQINRAGSYKSVVTYHNSSKQRDPIEMAAKLSQGLEDQVTCPICLEQFQDPRILTCLHTYCRRCLEGMLTKGRRRISIKCPECRETVKIEDVASLRVNIWVNRIISHLELFKTEKKQGDQSELMCNNCTSKEAAKAKCFDCGTFMCNACMAAHQRIVSLKDHQLMTLEDIKRTSVPIIDKLMFCKKHKGEVQKLFCKTCEELICRDCTIIDHKDHDVCFIVDIAKEHKEKLRKEIKMASATKDMIEAGLKSVKAMQQLVKKNTANIQKGIDDVINQQIQALEEKRINLKQESRDLAATKMKNLTAQEDGLAMHMTGLKSAIEFTENVLSKGSNSEVLSISKQILSRLSQLSSKPFDREVKDEDNQVLQVDKEMLSDGILQFAKVIDAVIDPEQCEVKWSKPKFGRYAINIYIKNRLGKRLDIEEKRISINPLMMGITGLTPLGNGLWIRDVASLKVNIWVNRIISHLELFKTEKKHGDQPALMCNNCDSKEAAKAKCFDCEKFMCNACMAAHQRIPTLKDHQLMTLEDIKRTGVPIIDKLMFCKMHKGEVQKLFCKTCEELICRDCTIIDHKDHDVCFIVDITKEHKEKLTKEIKMASATKEKIEAVLKSVKAMQQLVQKNTDDMQKEIDDFINQQIQALEEKRINLKQESRDLAATKMKNLTAQKEGLVMHMTGLKSAIEFTENVLSKGSNSEVLSISKQILSRLSQLSSKPFDGEVKDEDNQGLEVDKQMLNDGLLRFAKVVERAVIDPEQCEVKWSKSMFYWDVIHVHIKNRLGRPVDIEKKRISISTGMLMDISSLGNGSWRANVHELSLYDFHKVIPVTCNATEGHIVKGVEFKVDGHHIRGSPVEVYPIEMAAKLSQGLEDQVTCPICLEQYQDPRILTCLHTYCRRCLEGMLATKEGRRVSMKCPECQEMLKIEDVASLRVNIWVNRIISHLELFKAEKKQGDQPELMCNNCDSKEAAKAKCFDCGKFMCNACMAAHQRILTLKDHQLMTLEDIKRTGVPIIDKLMFCKKHKGEVQKLFCKTCEELICRDCTIIDHKDHDVCFIVDIAKEHKEKLRKEIKMASATKEKIEAGLKSVKAMQQLVKKNSAVIQKDIDDVVTQQIQALEEKRNDLKQESRDLAATKMKNLTAQEDGLAMHMTGLKSAIEFTENVLSKGSNSEVLSISKQILSRLSQLSSKPFEREVKDEDHQVLEVDKEMLSDGILKFAKVIDAFIDPGQCEVKWSNDKYGRDVINVYIKNQLGRPADINKKRISVNPSLSDLDNTVLIPFRNGSLWVANYGNYMNVHRRNPVKCNADEDHILKSINFKVDGRHIRGSPFQACIKLP
ncbi:hypothetical protein QZH41_015945 [Actinostola sp. cb2023]|nr:hypothetical protein QZH41_015945 [Actinostola sp. cb2023]